MTWVREKAGGLVTNGCVFAVFSPCIVGLRNRLLFDRPDRLTGDAVEHVEPALLGGHGQHLARLAVDVHVHHETPAGHVVVPQRVVHELVVPLPAAGLDVDGHHALRVEVVAEAVAAVLVDGRRLDGQIDEARLGVSRELGPGADVARPLPGAVLPRLVAGLARVGNRVEAPHLLARARIEGPDGALGVRAVDVAQALEHRRADDDDVADDERRGMQANLTLLQVDLLVLADDDALLEVDDAVLAEARRPAGRSWRSARPGDSRW